MGTLIVAGVLHFYMSRRGDGGLSGPELHSPDRGARDMPQSQLPTQFHDSPPTSNLSVGGGSNFIPSFSNVNHSTASFFAKAMQSAHRVVSITSYVIGSILQTYDKLTHGVAFIFNTPSRLGSSMIALFCMHAKNTSNFITYYWCHLRNICRGLFLWHEGNGSDSN